MTMRMLPRLGCITLALAILAMPTLALAQDTAAPTAQPTAPPTMAELAGITHEQLISNTLWVLIAALLVFFMNAGFAALETGLCRRKNAVNILAKNFIVFAVSSIAFWLVGCALMFGVDKGGFLGGSGFMPSLIGLGTVEFPGLDWAKLPISVKFFFQLAFAATAATIVSGVVAERIKFGAFILFSFVLVAVIYPMTGHWVWGLGWLASLETPFWDFAGSTVVHSVGGWAALAGVLLLGARRGKYNSDGSINPIPGHNIALAAIGCMILWLGWFGFNPGSTMEASIHIGHIAVTTNMAAACGAVAATATAWLVLGKPDLSMILNGCLAGLVAITAPCAWVTAGGAAIIGLVAGVLVVLSVLAWDKAKIDDPVGALSVHLVCGIWGTLAVGLFAHPDVMAAYAAGPKAGLFHGGDLSQLGAQFIGIGAVGGTVFVASLILWAALKFTLGIRVSEAEEFEGLDIGEHGMEAYPGFASESVGMEHAPARFTVGAGA